MPKLRRLSGAQVIAILDDFGFSPSSQKRSHIKLVKFAEGKKQILTIPNHKQIDTGTLRAIYRQALAYISEAELRTHFYYE